MTNEEQGKVLDLNTKSGFLPQSVRDTLAQQFEVSKVQGHSPEQFVAFAEKRILGEAALSGAQALKTFIDDLMGR